MAASQQRNMDLEIQSSTLATAGQTPSYKAQDLIEFNYSSPEIRSDGHLLIQPLFEPVAEVIHCKSKNDKLLAKKLDTELKLRVAKNTEIPSLLQAAGELTEQEHRRIQYHRLISEQWIFVGNSSTSISTACWLDEGVVARNEHIFERFQWLRKVLLEESKEVSGRSAFEVLLPSGDGRTTSRPERSYRGGATQNPQATDVMTAAVTKKVSQNPELVARVSRTLAELADYFARHYCPESELNMMDHHADVHVPFTFGGTFNKLFSSWHLNINDDNDAAIELTLGNGGHLHVDEKDDMRRWTVLLSLGNIGAGKWPGRTMITDIRCYAVMAPFTVLLFKAVRPHKSLGPITMGSSTRQPYIPATEVPSLDSRYLKARVTVANYMKYLIANESPALLRTTINADFVGESGRTNNPDSLPLAVSAFGTLDHLHLFHARCFAKNRARLAAASPSIVLPSARSIAEIFTYTENGEVHVPSTTAIQKVLEGNDPNNVSERSKREDLEAFEKLCTEILSMRHFDGMGRMAPIKWVDEVGASFASGLIEDVEKPNKKRLEKYELVQQAFGTDKVFECAVCGKRFGGKQGLASLGTHSKEHRGEVEYQAPEPTRDPNEGTQQSARAAKKRKRDEGADSDAAV